MELSDITNHGLKYINKLCSNHPKHDKSYGAILKKFYNEMVESEKIVNEYCSFTGNNRLVLENVDMLPDDYLPKEIKKHVLESCRLKLRYQKVLKEDKTITITFFFSEDYLIGINKLEQYIKRIMLWFIFAMKYSYKKCNSNININLYLTNPKKILPNSPVEVLDEMNVNTGVTYRCRENSNIVVYRKEEWFKVLIHESMHYLGLDFNSDSNPMLYDIFPLKGQTTMDLGEVYSETWARILNIYITSFKLTNSYLDFKKISSDLLYIERIFSCFQCVKILKFMGMDYNNITKKSDQVSISKRKLYKEKTNVFSYYILTAILMNNPYNFVFWCYKNNTNIIKLEPLTKIESFVLYIKKLYLSKSFLENIALVEDLFEKDYLMDKTLRMTIIEMN